MHKRKPKKYVIVICDSQGTINGTNSYLLKYVRRWPRIQLNFGVMFEISSDLKQAEKFGRDTALKVAHAINKRTSSASIAMVREV